MKENMKHGNIICKRIREIKDMISDEERRDNF